MAGEIVALGSELSHGKWNVGDRVCANFALEHLHGQSTPESVKTALGAPIDGVLREYIAVPAHVGTELLFLSEPNLINLIFFIRVLSVSLSTLHSRRHLLCRELHNECMCGAILTRYSTDVLV